MHVGPAEPAEEAPSKTSIEYHSDIPGAQSYLLAHDRRPGL